MRFRRSGVKLLAVTTSVILAATLPLPGAVASGIHDPSISDSDDQSSIEIAGSSNQDSKVAVPSALESMTTSHSLSELSIGASGAVLLEDSEGKAVPLTQVSGTGTGEEFYTGTTSAGKDVEVHVLQEVPEIEPPIEENAWNPGDPIEEVPVEGESHSIEEVVTPDELDASELEPILAIAKTDDTLSIATPEGTGIEEAQTFNSELNIPQAINQEINDNGSVTMSLQDADEALGVSLQTPDGISSLSVPIATAAAAKAVAKKHNWTEFYYTTFIPDSRVDAKICKATSGNWTTDWHNGNNRSWKNLSNPSEYESYKTVAGVKVDWTRGLLYNVAKVGVSKGYDKNMKPTVQRQASAAGIKFDSAKKSSSLVSWSVNHRVANPLCPGAGAITYTAKASMYRSGVIKYLSRFIQVPSHEMYARTNLKGSWTDMGRFHRKDFMCLSIPCGYQSYNITKTLPIR